MLTASKDIRIKQFNSFLTSPKLRQFRYLMRATPFLFADEDVDTFYLEYDDERSGGFSPLKHVAEGKKVVLGLITSKSPVLEDKATVMARIREAAQYIPLDRLSLSPQCGFASCEIGNRLTEEEQWAKLDLAREISEEVWG